MSCYKVPGLFLHPITSGRHCVHLDIIQVKLQIQKVM